MKRFDYPIAQRSRSSIQEPGKGEITDSQNVKHRRLTAQWVKIDGQLICQWSK